MTGAAIASAVVGVGNLIGGNKARKASERADAKANAAAERQWQYSQNMMKEYQTWAGENMDNVAEMEWGGGSYEGSTYENQAYESQGYSPAQLGNPNQAGFQEAQFNQAGFQEAQGNNQRGIGLAQKMLDEWGDTFGSLEDNLSDYYNNLDPTKFATQNKVALQDSLNKSMAQFNETMAASGLQSAGMKQQAAKEAMFSQARGNAQIDLESPEQVAQMQQGFLNRGDQYKMGAQSYLANATNVDSQMNQQNSQFNSNQFSNNSQFNANQMANNSQFNANKFSSNSQFNAGNANNFNMANFNARNDANRYGADAANNANKFNAEAGNVANRYNSTSRDQANRYNLDSQNRAIELGNNANINARNNYGNSYLQMAGVENPMIARYDNQAKNYGASQAGYNQAAGQAFGAAMRSGVSAYDNSKKDD